MTRSHLASREFGRVVSGSRCAIRKFRNDVVYELRKNCRTEDFR